MILNIILVVLGAISLFYGIKNKLKLWMVIGLILLGCGVFSAYVDYRMLSTADPLSPNARLPFVMNNMMK